MFSKYSMFWDCNNITGIIVYACSHPNMILTEEKAIIETEVPVHYHSSFSQAHEFSLDSQVNQIEAAVSPVKIK